jgi:hypothetical protein
VQLGSGKGGLPSIAALGLVMVGLGLIGMTAGELPGIAEQLAAPRWLMGVLGGILVGAGAQSGRDPRKNALRRAPAWVDLVAFGVGGIVLAKLSEYTRVAGSFNDPLTLGTAINGVARIIFGIGIGIIIGWVAYEASRARTPSDDRP